MKMIVSNSVSVVFMIGTAFALTHGCDMRSNEWRTDVRPETLPALFRLNVEFETTVIAQRLFKALQSRVVSGETLHCVLDEQSDQPLACSISKDGSPMSVLFSKRKRIVSVSWTYPVKTQPDYKSVRNFFDSLKEEVGRAITSEFGPGSVTKY